MTADLPSGAALDPSVYDWALRVAMAPDVPSGLSREPSADEWGLWALAARTSMLLASSQKALLDQAAGAGVWPAAEFFEGLSAFEEQAMGALTAGDPAALERVAVELEAWVGQASADLAAAVAALKPYAAALRTAQEDLRMLMFQVCELRAPTDEERELAYQLHRNQRERWSLGEPQSSVDLAGTILFMPMIAVVAPFGVAASLADASGIKRNLRSVEGEREDRLAALEAGVPAARSAFYTARDQWAAALAAATVPCELTAPELDPAGWPLRCAVHDATGSSRMVSALFGEPVAPNRFRPPRRTRDGGHGW